MAGTLYEVDADLAGETVLLWSGLFDQDLYVEHGDARFGPDHPVGGPVPLHHYRQHKKGKRVRRADRVAVLASALQVPRAVLEGHPALAAASAGPAVPTLPRRCIGARTCLLASGRPCGYFPSMPFKHNAACRHRIPRARYRVMNFPAYEAGLRQGDLTLWLDQAALDSWAAPKRGSPGGQPLYCDLDIELVLTLRLVFHLALRQAEAFSRSMLRLLILALTVPDHSTLSRRGRAFAEGQPRVLASAGPVHLVLDSTGRELFGQGEWDAERYGRTRRQSRKLHPAVDAEPGETLPMC